MILLNRYVFNKHQRPSRNRGTVTTHIVDIDRSFLEHVVEIWNARTCIFFIVLCRVGFQNSDITFWATNSSSGLMRRVWSHLRTKLFKHLSNKGRFTSSLALILWLNINPAETIQHPMLYLAHSWWLCQTSNLCCYNKCTRPLLLMLIYLL